MISKKTVLITGCSNGGIGSALARTFHHRGWHVFATARDTSKMSELNGLSDLTQLTLDLVKSDDIKVVAEHVSKLAQGKLDCLVNNAGRNHFMPILDEDLDVVKDLFQINFYGPLALTQAFVPLLTASEGMAVYITSISGYVSNKYMGTYAASKRSLEIVADTLRHEIAPFGVGVLEVVTGDVKTNGQTYLGDIKLPPDSWYKSQEDDITNMAQGKGGFPKMETDDYATGVVNEIINRTTGRFWYGNNADLVRITTTATDVPQSVIASRIISRRVTHLLTKPTQDAVTLTGTGLDAFGQ
ncbi:hypothetical protein PG994_002537 [Apiospora phragmitis]|uniref:Uncharacterized protein n=1 Tax=Apiospora phragmitis TaxID=2905665 RepID=A0ABR1W5F3_9PEZI